MKIELPKEQLLEAVASVERVSGKTMALPVLQCVVIEAKKAGVVLRATNLEIGIERSVPAKIHQEGVVAVPATVLGSTIAHLRGSTPVVLTADQATLTVEADGGSAKIKLIPLEEFPTLPRVEEGSVTVPGVAVARCLRAVSYCASSSTIKPELGSVYLTGRDGTLIAAATDSFRLAERITPFSGEAFAPILIPIRSVAELSRVLEETGDDPVTLSMSAHQAALEAGSTYLTLRLIEGSFPDYRKIIPESFTAEAVALKGDLLHALRKAAVFADKFNQATITVDPKLSLIRIFTRNPDVGEVEDSVPATVTGEGLTLSFNLRYITDAFQSIADDSVSLSFSGPGRPMVLRGANEVGFTYLVMPMNR